MRRIKDKIEGSITNADYASSAESATKATTASKLGTNAGSVTQPVYFKDGVPVTTTYALNKTVPADAKFTDTTYSSLKNPYALTVQTNGTTAATYDGSAAKTVNVTKASIGLGNVENTKDADKTVKSAGAAGKLSTARTVSGGSDIVLSFNYDGSTNSTANIGFYSCSAQNGNTNNYLFHRFAKLDTITSSYTDKTMTVYITQDYNGGGFGICRLSLRTNSSTATSSVEAKWLMRSGLPVDFVQVAIYNVYGKTYADAFLKINSGYAYTSVSALESGGRNTRARTWTLVNSKEVDGTTADDKKTSTECWKTIADAGTALHNQAYSTSAPAIDSGTAGAASSGGSATSAVKLDTSAGGATQPVYFKDGKPVATTYALNKTVPADAKFTDTTYGDMKGASTASAGTAGLVPAPTAGAATRYLRSDGSWQVPPNTWRGIQNSLTSNSTTDSLSAAQGKTLKTLVDGKAEKDHIHVTLQDEDTTHTVWFDLNSDRISPENNYWLCAHTDNYENGFEIRDINVGDLKKSIYPVGSIYLSVESTSPASLFGGSWERIEDRFLLAAGDSYSVGDTGGEATHTLTTSEMPEHNHIIGNKPGSGGTPQIWFNQWDWYLKDVWYQFYSGTTTLGSCTRTNGGGQSHNNMPPYYTVYMWKRVA